MINVRKVAALNFDSDELKEHLKTLRAHAHDAAVKGQNAALHAPLLSKRVRRSGYDPEMLESFKPFKEAEYAPGIPDRKKIQPLPEVKKPKDWTFALQHHKADRAGEHLDLRLVDPDTGHAHSWALPAAVMPEPGKSVLAVPQPTHTEEYALNFGKGKPREIMEGYGKGTVAMQDQHPAEVFHAKPEDEGTKVRFNLYRGTHPEEYAIVHTSDGNNRLVNKTLSRSRLGHLPLGEKPVLKEKAPENVDVDNTSEVMMPKLDGAHSIIDLKDAGRIPRVFSYRHAKRAKSGVIEHTHKIPSMIEQRIPKELARTILRGETIAVKSDGYAVEAKDIAGMLNASVPKSRAKQKELGTNLEAVAFDVIKFKGKDVTALPFRERREMLQEVADKTDIRIVDVATTPSQKRKLIGRIRKGKHKLTNEGVVLRPMDTPGKAVKAKFRPDHDVYVREIFGATGKDGKPKDRAGGFEYSWTPKGKVVGRVGTGFTHQIAKDMLADPAQYVGRVAKVKAERKYDSGALGKASFQEWHLDKGNIEKEAKVKTELQPHQKRVVKKMQLEDQPGLLVAHGLGSGKTLTSIATQDALGLPSDVLVPAALQENYLKERKKHLDGKSPEVLLTTLQRVSRSGVTGTNPLLIVDEAHRAREPSTKAQRALRNSPAEKRLLLTASPFYNRPSDISGLVNIVAGSNVLPLDPTEFKKTFITQDKVNPGLLGMLMGQRPGVKERINPRQAKNLKKVLDKWVDYHASSTEEFPEVERKIVAVPMGPRQRKIYDAVIGEAPAWVRYKVKRGLPPSKQESRQLNAFAGAVRQISNTTRAHAPDEEPEEAKIEFAFQQLKKELDSNKRSKAIVYSNYLDAGVVPYRERLVKAKVPFGEYTGEMKKTDRDQLVNDFNEGKKKVILLSSAGGEGLDLKGTRLVQVLEPHWNNEKLRQVEGRAIRYKSHAHLPKSEQKVRVENYVATKPRRGILEKAKVMSPGGGIDEYLDTMATDKDKLIDQFKALLKS